MAHRCVLHLGCWDSRGAGRCVRQGRHASIRWQPVGADAYGPGVTTPPTSPPSSAGASAMRRWWASTSEGLPRAFWVIFAGTIVNRLGQFVQPFLALYLVGGRDLSVKTAGVVVACYGAGSIVSQPLGGWLADRVGRRRTMVLGLVATATSLGVLGVSRPLWAIGAAAALVGLAMDIYRPGRRRGRRRPGAAGGSTTRVRAGLLGDQPRRVRVGHPRRVPRRARVVAALRARRRHLPGVRGLHRPRGARRPHRARRERPRRLRSGPARPARRRALRHHHRRGDRLHAVVRGAAAGDEGRRPAAVGVRHRVRGKPDRDHRHPAAYAAVAARRATRSPSSPRRFSFSGPASG